MFQWNITSCRSLYLALISICFVIAVIFMSMQSTPSVQPKMFSRIQSAFGFNDKGLSLQSPEGKQRISTSKVNVSYHLFEKTSPMSSSLRHLSLNEKHTSNSTPVCRQQIVFIKTHKTGSTTMASIFERYGFYRNLTFAVGRGHVLSEQKNFSRKNVMDFPGMRGLAYNILTNHARYNRKEMDMVVPNATYLTLLRKPEDQVASAFGYYEMYRQIGLGKEPNPLKTFMDDPHKYYNDRKFVQGRNGQLFDLGLEHKYDEDEEKIWEKIIEIERDFDLVMISEYFDESLLLMKKLLCWDFVDILYFPKNVRSASHKFEKDRILREKLSNWSHGDVLFYEHFNITFWKKVAEYGPNFEIDLQHFRDINKGMFDDCIDLTKVDQNDSRVDKFVLKNNSEICKSLLRADVPYTNMIRKAMVSRFGSPTN